MILLWIMSVCRIAKIKNILRCLVIVCVVTGCKPPGEPALIIATSANMQFAMEALSSGFYEEYGIQPQIVCGSSGKLTAQIRAGAPFDIFISADMVYPLALYKDGLAESEPLEYARGQLALWTLTEDSLVTLDNLCYAGTQYIAIANPQTAPYGKAAIQILENYGIWDKVESKLVYAESISQVSQFVLSGAADYGFIARSIVSSPEVAGKGCWISLDSTMYAPIRQGAVLLKKKDGKHPDSKLFMKFLFSDHAGAILKNYGYIVPHRGEEDE